ncbi:MAG: hypothetical protein KDC39_03905 [Actinobacteria bacterium]|nr:hypothetical protein [Actinomycetota bacterium]
MDIIIMILMTVLVFTIYRASKPTIVIPLWAVTGLLVLILLRMHATDTLPLEF